MFSKFNEPCLSCRWQGEIKSYETPIYKDNSVIWRNDTFKIGSAIFLEPGQTKFSPEPSIEKYIEKKIDINKGSNLDTPEPFTIGLIEDIKNQKNDIKIRVRMFYRPEDTREAHFSAYVKDINYLYWTQDVIWTTFKNVAKADGYYNLRSRRENTITKNILLEKAPEWTNPNVPLRCMDIYSGCGGLSEGLHQAKAANTLWAIDKEMAPAQAFQLNNPQCHVYLDDCNNVLRTILSGKGKDIGLPGKGDVDLLVGGPPCQGFSPMNRFSSGQYSCFNNSQIITYLSYCDYYRPKYLIFENVRNFVSFKKGTVLKLTLKCLLAMGYQISFGIVQAGNFGVPQTRRRFILMGAAPGCVLPNLPEPQHVFSRAGTFLSIVVDGLRYDSGSRWNESLPYRTICVRDAIADLPEINNGAIDIELLYDEQAKKTNKTGLVKEHICKELSPLVEARILHIPTYPGADWRDLPNKVVELKDGSLTNILKYSYRTKTQSTADTPKGVCSCSIGAKCNPSDRQSNTLIPWCLAHTANRHNNWASVYGRLEWDGYFGTTVTNPEPMGTQGRVLHPEQNRVVSVRECARSQGFQDAYKFYGNILDKHRQIGNAVPPPLAIALGKELIKAHKQTTETKK
ncbi:hypothetical protein NQ317_000124 [Molorchus minor]|uniref:Cytosine-specific methyltransferase n=1 Tax=Molorchus minor TaxID=1323400 RepID=A0ABQ9JU61_9CUCU|nr:hypothetical protein NQ317_000124 [Molorchus minor]